MGNRVGAGGVWPTRQKMGEGFGKQEVWVYERGQFKWGRGAVQLAVPRATSQPMYGRKANQFLQGGGTYGEGGTGGCSTDRRFKKIVLLNRCFIGKARGRGGSSLMVWHKFEKEEPMHRVCTGLPGRLSERQMIGWRRTAISARTKNTPGQEGASEGLCLGKSLTAPGRPYLRDGGGGGCWTGKRHDTTMGARRRWPGYTAKVQRSG